MRAPATPRLASVPRLGHRQPTPWASQQGHQPIESGDDTAGWGECSSRSERLRHQSERTAVRSTPVAGLPKIEGATQPPLRAIFAVQYSLDGLCSVLIKRQSLGRLWPVALGPSPCLFWGCRRCLQFPPLKASDPCQPPYSNGLKNIFKLPGQKMIATWSKPCRILLTPFAL